jgi:hypothetical protein
MWGMARWMVLSFLWLGGCTSTGQVYPGDKTEQRSCRWCNGSGVESGDAYDGSPPPGVRPGGACPGCAGAKKVTVILPGPEHPTWVKGTIRDSKVAENLPIEALLTENQRPMQPVAGAISGAKLEFEGPSGKVPTASNNTGRFKLFLKPGHYKVRIQAAGFAEKSQEFDVPARQQPIWQEKAKLVTEQSKADEFPLDLTL